jgi:RHS repeat-associated protein
MPRTTYFWDEDNILAEYDENGDVRAEYTYEAQQYGNLISDQTAPNYSQYHYDAIGSTVDVTNDQQQPVDSTRYSAFGQETAVMAKPFAFCGRVGYYHDTELGSFYVRRRNYAALHGRWLSVEPLMTELYKYVQNSPVNSNDPSGLFGQSTIPVKYPLGMISTTTNAPSQFGSLLMCLVGECDEDEKLISLKNVAKVTKVIDQEIDEFFEKFIFEGKPSRPTAIKRRAAKPKPLRTIYWIFQRESHEIVCCAKAGVVRLVKDKVTDDVPETYMILAPLKVGALSHDNLDAITGIVHPVPYWKFGVQKGSEQEECLLLAAKISFGPVNLPNTPLPTPTPKPTPK